MNLLFSPIEFGTPQFDEALRLRESHLRKPLGLSFEIEDIILDYLEYHFGLYSKGILAGCLSFRPLEKAILKMRQVVIDTPFQEKGLGSIMVKESERWAKLKGVSKIELNARKTALSFYKRLDYEVIGSEFKEVGIPHFKMFKMIH